MKHFTAVAISVAVVSLHMLGCGEPLGERGGSAVVDCAPSLGFYDRVPWSEPDRPQAASPPMDPPQQGWQLKRTLAPDANSGDLPTAWLTDDEDLSGELSIAYGKEETTPRTVSVSMFIDGLQVRIPNPDGQPVAALKQMLAPGEVKSFAMQVPAAEISRGAHSGNILVKRDPAVELFGVDVTLLKDSATFSPRTVPVDGAPEPADGSAARVFVTDRPNALLRGDIDLAEGAGELPLSFVIKATRDTCVDHNYRFVLVALLDDVQVEIPGHAMAPAFELRGDQEIHLAATFSELPIDGAPHILEFWLLPDGAYGEAPGGKIAPWSEWARQLGWSRWQ